MKKALLVSFLASFFCGSVLAQTTGTFVVADNGNHMSSCLDIDITLNDIYTQLGIRDLHDTDEDVSNYRLLELNGSVITQTEITEPFKYSDYSSIFIEKKDTEFTGHNGLPIYIRIIIPPTSLFNEDTLKYVVDKGEQVWITEDFFNAFEFWNSGKDELDLSERILFKDMSTNIELPISQVPSWAQLSPGLYKYTYFVSVCETSDIFVDSMFVKVTESLCHSVMIKNNPSFCRDEIADITPYVYVDGELATTVELADMVFYNRSNMLNPEIFEEINPAAFDMNQMWNQTDLYPRIEIAYQPNVALGTCEQYTYMPDMRVPSKFIVTDVLMPTDNFGKNMPFTVENEYYAFNNIFNKNILQELYLDNFNVYNGTTFHFYTDTDYENEITTDEIPVGDYHLLALNPACDQDTGKFLIHVKESDFKIVFENVQNLGKGYYTFTAPLYSSGNYEWILWGGTVVSGQGTNQVTVYYPENASKGVFVKCKITFPATRISADEASLYAAVYLRENENGDKEPIVGEVTTDIYEEISTTFVSAYPNPSDGVLHLSGDNEFDVKIYNSFGQLVFEQRNYVPNTTITLESKGMHVAHLIQDGRIQTIKIVVK